MPLLHSFCTFGFHIYPKCCGVPLEISRFFSPIYILVFGTVLFEMLKSKASQIYMIWLILRERCFKIFFLCFMSWKMPHIEYLREMGKHNLEIRKKSLSNVKKKKCPKSLKQNLNGLRYIRIFCTQVNKES